VLIIPHKGQVVSYSIAVSGGDMALVYSWRTAHAWEVYVTPLAKSDQHGRWRSYFGDTFSTIAISDMMLHLDDNVYYLPLLIDEAYGWLRELDREFVSASEMWHSRIADKLRHGGGDVYEQVIAVYALLDVYTDGDAYIALVGRSRAFNADRLGYIGDWRTNAYVVARYNNDGTFTLTVLPFERYKSIEFGQFVSVVLTRGDGDRSDDIMEIVDTSVFFAVVKRANAINNNLRQVAETVKRYLLYGE